MIFSPDAAISSHDEKKSFAAATILYDDYDDVFWRFCALCRCCSVCDTVVCGCPYVTYYRLAIPVHLVSASNLI